jgi:DNA polymerase III delta prime subunit
MENQLTEKYRPGLPSDMIGSHSQISITRNFLRWWLKGSPYIKALRFIGREGIGKTTLALAIAKEFDLPVHITNAGDERKRGQIIYLEKSSLLMSLGGGRRLIIIDEADSLSKRKRPGKGKERAQERLVKVIEKTKNPIIIIANDDRKFTKDIRESTQKVEFKLPTHGEKVSLIKRIIEGERRKISKRDIKIIAKRSETLRQVVITLQGRSITDKDTFGDEFKQVQSILDGDPIEIDMKPKDLAVWIFDNTRNHEAVSIADRLNAFQYHGLEKKYPIQLLSLVSKPGSKVSFPSTFLMMKKFKPKEERKTTKKKNKVTVKKTKPMEYKELTVEGKSGLEKFFV